MQYSRESELLIWKALQYSIQVLRRMPPFQSKSITGADFSIASTFETLFWNQKGPLSLSDTSRSSALYLECAYLHLFRLVVASQS